MSLYATTAFVNEIALPSSHKIEFCNVRPMPALRLVPFFVKVQLVTSATPLSPDPLFPTMLQLIKEGRDSVPHRMASERLPWKLQFTIAGADVNVFHIVAV